MTVYPHAWWWKRKPYVYDPERDDAAEDRALFESLAGHSVTDVDWDEQGVALTLDDGRIILLSATGMHTEGYLCIDDITANRPTSA